MQLHKYLFTLLLIGCCIQGSFAQQLGLNFNHNPENIDFKYVEKVHPDWIRTTPRILDYVDGLLHPDSNPGLENIIKAGQQGYQIVFGFRWDFKKRHLLLPEPGSAREAKYFAMVDQIMEKVGPYAKIFTLGNEPNLETVESDLHYNEHHEVPLVVFTRRLMQHIIGFYQKHPGWQLPQLYAGSLPALFEKQQQQKPGVVELIRFAQQTKEIAGLAIHLHIADTLEIALAFQFVRTLMATKPIIVPEFSLFRRYNQHFKDRICFSIAGQAFLRKHHLPPAMKVYEWLSQVNSGKIPYAQWLEMFQSQPWYIPHYLNTYYRYFHKYGVLLATYPLLQQGYTKRVTASSASWWLNPLYLQKSFGTDAQGDYYPNPLVYKDYVRLLKRGRKNVENQKKTGDALN